MAVDAVTADAAGVAAAVELPDSTTLPFASYTGCPDAWLIVLGSGGGQGVGFGHGVGLHTGGGE